MRLLHKIAAALLLAGTGYGASLAPAQALEQYLARSRDGQPGCSQSVFSIQIEASLPKLKKRGSMSGLKMVSQTGQIVYRGLRFTGDNVVKTAVIARFLAKDAEPPADGVSINLQNYSFVYAKTADYNGISAHVFRLTPKRKRVGAFKGELWLNAATAAQLRLWGDFVKSPSLFLRSFRFVEDFQGSNQCSPPLRLLFTAQTLIAGEADVAVWQHSVADPTPVAAEGDSCADCATNRAATQGN